MPVVVAPSTQIIPPGDANHPNVIASVVLNTGDLLDFGFASAQPDPGVTRTTFNLSLRQVGPGPLLIHRDTRYTETNVSVRYTAAGPIGVQLELSGGGTPAGSSHGLAFGYHAESTLQSLVYCQYGTRQKALGDTLWLTPEIISLALQAVNASWLGPFLSIFWYTYISISDLCAAGPPSLPTPVDSNDLVASATSLKRVLDAILWPTYCECLPGTPTPVPFPPPQLTVPPNQPPPPTFTCDPALICDTLIKIQQQLAALSAVASQTYQLTTLQQRYSLPFAYIRGATHSNITNSIAFAIPRLVGVQIVVQQFPSPATTFTGAPAYIADLGWVSILDNDGMLDEIRLTREVQVWIPPKMATASQLGLALREGVSVSVTELEAEP